LALTLAVQQFLTPIYRFRLRAYGLKIAYLILPVFAGFVCSVVAALLPNLPVPHRSLLEYPVVLPVPNYFRKMARRCLALSKTAVEPELTEQMRIWAVDLTDEADQAECRDRRGRMVHRERR
jgi:hypothetical protein